MKHYDLYAIGNALVDETYTITDTQLEEFNIEKGGMNLVDAEHLTRLRQAMSNSTPERIGGGSAANSTFALTGFGGRGFYCCRIADDATGNFFTEELGKAGIDLNPIDLSIKGISGCCLVFVTPDAERTMNTYLGVSEEISETDINQGALKHSETLFIEGYLAASTTGTSAAIHARKFAEEHQIQTSLTLSDPSMVTNFRDSLEKICGEHVDTLFCNEEEALSWKGSDRVDLAIRELREIASNVFVTLGKNGSICSSSDGQYQVKTSPVEAVDTNGAGDMYAGACLSALSTGSSAYEAAKFGNFAASKLVTQPGARLSNIQAYKNIKTGYKPL